MVEVARSPSLDDVPGNPTAFTPPEPVLLPPNQPGRLDSASTAGTSRASGSRSKPQREEPRDDSSAFQVNLGPAVNTKEHLDRIGREEAAATLPNEMSMMLPVGSPGFSEVALMCGQENAPLDDVWRSFVEKLIDLLWAPPAGILSRLPGLSETDVRAKIQLFWRCAVALCIMPLSQLRMLSQRKAKICSALASCLPGDGASPPAERLAHLRLNLPVFSMVADMPREEKPASPPVCSTEGAAAAAPGRAQPEEGPGAAATALEEEKEETLDEVIIEEVTESRSSATTESQGSASRPPQPKVVSAEKENSAARHTYDLGYKKWENFDVDTALRDVDRPEPRKQKVDLEALRAKERRQELDFDDPVQALSKVIEESRKREAAAKAVETATVAVESATESAEAPAEAPRGPAEAAAKAVETASDAVESATEPAEAPQEPAKATAAAPGMSVAGAAKSKAAPVSAEASSESAESSRVVQVPSTAPLEKGTRVVIHGTSREDLNGLSGEVIARDAKADRIAVTLSDGRKMRFRPANLRTEDGNKTVTETDVNLEKKQTPSEYTGVVSGKYDWADKPENTRAAPLPVEKITEYSWRDEGKREGLMPSRDDGDIGIYVEIPGLDSIKDEDIMFKAGGRHVSLIFNLEGKERNLHIDNLAHDITRGWMMRKKGKNRIVIKLRKKSNAIWNNLTGFSLSK